MADQLPIISGTRAINTTATASTSLIGRGLSAIQRKETGIALTELDARYRQVRDIYNRITDYGRGKYFNADLLPKPIELVEDKKLLQLQPFFAMIQQLADVFTAFQQLADTGYGKAYFPLASIYQGGQGISQNIEKSDYYSRLAFDWCFANQALNDPEIWRDLGSMYYHGNDVEQDDEQAAFWFCKAAEQGNADAQLYLGLICQRGRGVERGIEQAVFWYRKATGLGLATAQYRLGDRYKYSHNVENSGVEQDDAQAVFWYRKAAEQGHVEAQYTLGSKYCFGDCVKKDYVQAVFWYRKAAEQGHVKAQSFLGYLYQGGRGIEQDSNQAIFWFRNATEQGDSFAQWQLGKMYQMGQGVEQDYKQAMFWYHSAAEHDEMYQFDLGSMYYHGHDNYRNRTEQDFKQAAFWFRKAAEQELDELEYELEGGDYTSCADASEYLGTMYSHGHGVEQDNKQAAFWFSKAAERGKATAQFSIGRMYANGRGVEQDDAQAVFWYRKAAEQGHVEAQENLTKLGINWKDT